MTFSKAYQALYAGRGGLGGYPVLYFHPGPMSYAVSPTQIVTAFDPETGCLRKWGHNQIDGIRGPSSPSMQLGTDMHAQLERWYRSIGEVPPDNSDPGILAQQGLSERTKPRPISPLWPGPEFAFKFSVGNVDYRGTIDLPYVSTDESAAVEWPYKSGVAVVEDHKSTSNLKYAKTSADLEKDHQRVIYSIAALRHFDTDEVAAKWNYTQTKPTREGFPTLSVEYGPEPADKTLWQFENDTHPKAQELVKLRKFAARDLPQNFGACNAFYRKCDFYDRCHSGVTVDGVRPNPTVQLRTLGGATAKEIDPMANSLLEQMRAGGAVAPPSNPNAAPVVEKPTPAPAAKPAGGGLLGMFGKKTAPAEPSPAPVVEVEGPLLPPKPTPNADAQKQAAIDAATIEAEKALAEIIAKKTGAREAVYGSDGDDSPKQSAPRVFGSIPTPVRSSAFDAALEKTAVALLDNMLGVLNASTVDVNALDPLTRALSTILAYRSF